MTVQMGHVSLCVSDVYRSLRFYTSAQGLGFVVQDRIEGDDLWAALAEIEPPLEMTAQFIEKDGTRLELLAYAKSGVCGEPSRTRNQLGAMVIESTRTQLPGFALLVLKDPDGARIEVLKGS